MLGLQLREQKRNGVRHLMDESEASRAHIGISTGIGVSRHRRRRGYRQGPSRGRSLLCWCFYLVAQLAR